MLKINNYLCKSCRSLARHAFLSFLVLLLVSLLLGALLFYKYSYLTAKTEPEVSDKTTQFKKDLFQKVIDEWQNRQERSEGADTKKYLDSFR